MVLFDPLNEKDIATGCEVIAGKDWNSRALRVIKFVIIIFIKCNILYGARFAVTSSDKRYGPDEVIPTINAPTLIVRLKFTARN